MPRHTETRFLPYTPEQMFDLVADVGRYAEFLPWVSAVRLRSDTPGAAGGVVGVFIGRFDLVQLSDACRYGNEIGRASCRERV